MAVQPQFLTWILEQLGGLGSLRSNRMFGCVGLYSNEVFFGLIDDDTLYFKTDDSNIAGYRERRMPRFMPFPDRPEAVLGYHQVPADVMEDSEVLIEWARKSIAVAAALKAAKSPKAKFAGTKVTKKSKKKVQAKQAARKSPRKSRLRKKTARR